MIDTHLHLFDRSQLTYPWMAGRDLPEASLPDEVGRSIVIEAGVKQDQVTCEVEWVRTLAADHPELLGMVAAVDFDSATSADLIDSYSHDPFVVGVRHNFEGLSRGCLNTDAHRAGAAAALDAGLTIDLCVRAEQLDELADFLVNLQASGADTDRCVLDHLGKPLIAQWGSDGCSAPREYRAWLHGIERLAARTGVMVKISGLGGQMAGTLHSSQLRSALVTYGSTVLAAFGSSRTMLGSDHPVSTHPRGLGLHDWHVAVDAVVAETRVSPPFPQARCESRDGRDLLGSLERAAYRFYRPASALTPTTTG